MPGWDYVDNAAEWEALEATSAARDRNAIASPYLCAELAALLIPDGAPAETIDIDPA